MHLQPPTDVDRRHILSNDGTRIYADAVGNPENPAIVFAHGFGSTAEVFNDLFSDPSFSERKYLIRYDQRGNGRSGRPQDHTSQRYAEDFEAVLKAFGAKKAIFVGWSMGGRILADIASHLPRGVILGAVGLSGTPYNDPAFGPVIRPAMTSFTSKFFSSPDPVVHHHCMLANNRLLFTRDIDAGPGFLDDTIRRSEAGDDFVDENEDVGYLTRVAIAGMTSSMSPADRVLVTSRTQDNTAVMEWAKEGFPYLVIHGSHDAFFDGEKMLDVLRPTFKDLEVAMIDKGSHIPFVEFPQQVTERILRFSDRLAS